jgi:hypothetical protein
MAYFAVDRIEGEKAVLVGDDGRTIDVARSALPAACHEGTVLRVSGEPPDWARAVPDEAERMRRLDQTRDTLRRLEETDPGGDVIL